MEVLVDTTIWSLALRRRPIDLMPRDLALVEEWRRLVLSGDALLVGPIRQEVLSGIREPTTFALLRERLNDFRHLAVVPGDYDRAAELFNRCRAAGVAATAVDMVICAVAERFEVPVFTTDRDFLHYARCISTRLYEQPLLGR